LIVHRRERGGETEPRRVDGNRSAGAADLSVAAGERNRLPEYSCDRRLGPGRNAGNDLSLQARET
jgi:hypothetical protein